jgi:AraC-like DNA-binding protein
MDVIWNQTKIQNLLNSFFTLRKIRVGFFDLEGKEIIAYPSAKSDFCNFVRSTPGGEEACRRCDRDAFSKAPGHHGPYIYQCHAGLTEAIAPIITSEEKRIGYLMFGQLRQPENEDERRWKELRRKIGHSDMEALKAAYLKLTVLRLDEVRSCATILQALASYVWLDNYIRIQNEPLSSRVKTYIAGSLDGDLSLAGIAGHFGVGKTSLCKAVKRDCSLTVNELVKSARIERAKQLLQSGKQPVAEIAEQVGIRDYNYFTKVFKEEVGVPPSMFRKLCENGYLYKQSEREQAAHVTKALPQPG